MIKSVGNAKLAHMIDGKLDKCIVESDNGHMAITIDIWHTADIVEDIHYKVFKTDVKTGDDNIVASDVMWGYAFNSYSTYKLCIQDILDILLKYTLDDIECNKVSDLFMLVTLRLREIIGVFDD